MRSMANASLAISLPLVTLVTLVTLGLAGCERNQPAASPASCNCGSKQNGPPPAPAREEPADILR